MSRRGPPPKPARQKKLAGNPGKRALPKNEPKPPAAEPSCPTWLSNEAKDEWQRITPILREMKLLSNADEIALASYCQAAAELQICTETIEVEGRFVDEIVRDRQGKVVEETIKGKKCQVVRTKAHPALKAQRDAFARVRAFLQEFGLSPSARARIGDPNDNDGTDPIAPLILKMQQRNAAS